MKPEPGDSFQCAMCGGWFPLGDDDEVVAEMKDLFGIDTAVDECDTVCDDCFNTIMRQ